MDLQFCFVYMSEFSFKCHTAGDKRTRARFKRGTGRVYSKYFKLLIENETHRALRRLFKMLHLSFQAV